MSTAQTEPLFCLKEGFADILGRNVKAMWTGELRPPLKGEWYLSDHGGETLCYRAIDNFENTMRIARLVTNGKPIDNSLLPAGSPMVFSCNVCNNIAEVLHEEYDRTQIKPRTICVMCEQLKFWRSAPNEEGWSERRIPVSHWEKEDVVMFDIGGDGQPVIINVLGVVRDIHVIGEYADVLLDVRRASDEKLGDRRFMVASGRFVKVRRRDKPAINVAMDKATADVIIDALTRVCNNPNTRHGEERKFREAMAVIQTGTGYLEACNLNWN